ncbi:MAG: 23S rRNA (uracil(1939)-C(5))-methyltransferase RlmD [Candidatus Binatia bacterium]|nr:23S rRNA (uracil(1939)-C(5))-methyltransferase RlmD [Candidatus Binatia bacterium]
MAAPRKPAKGKGARRPTKRRTAGQRPAARGTAETQAKTGARCEHFPQCVGCPWVDRAYGAQLAEKHERLKAALEQHRELGRYRLVDPSGSPHRFGYRNHAKLVFRARRIQKGRETLLGVYKPGTHSVMPAEACSVHDRLLQPFLRDLLEEVQQRGVSIFDERRRGGDLRYALARSSRLSGKIHLTLVSARSRPAWLGELIRALRRRHPELESAFLCTNPTPGNALLTRDIHNIFGPPALLERLGDRILESQPDAFLQANPDVATNIYRAAVKAFRGPPSARILDVYCGVGAIGLSVVRPGDRLLGIESSVSAIACARSNARRARVRNTRFAAASAEGVKHVAAQHGMPEPDVVVVNPPRKGLGAPVTQQILELAPAQVLYVSCDPDTLARDLRMFTTHGYKLERVQAFDMLPQTPHVEALAVLSRHGAVSPRR